MALTIVSSNRVEILQQQLCADLSTRRLRNPLTREIIVVPTFAMARWLNIQIAQQQGIAANIDYPQPARWLWQLAASQLEALTPQDPLQPEPTSWKVFSLLPGLLALPAFKSLSLYLLDDDTGVKRWQLSTRIAEVFDRYQQYRPAMILDWSAGKGDDWQALLWRALIQTLGQGHRSEVLAQLLTELHSGAGPQNLPERVSLFAVSSLAPIHIEVVHALALHTDVRLYQHSPTNHYWADLKNLKSIARKRLLEPQAAEYFQTGNELLASWGRQGQAMQDLLLDQGDLPVTELDASQAPGQETLLQCLQQSIFDLDADSLTPDADASIALHLCHSPMRECQVLHDQLLALLDSDASLSSEDILVMVPEISRYAPYVEAAFRSDENRSRPNLAWNLSDISIADEHPLVLSFLQLLKLPTSRFAYADIIALLDVEEIRQRFDIDAQALEQIVTILSEANLRWGIDPAHKTSLGLPATAENTWQQARQRVMAGYAFDAVELWNGIAPLPGIEPERALNMGKFWHFFDRLLYWRAQLDSNLGALQWQQRLNRLLDEFFLELDPQANVVQQIRDSIAELQAAGNLNLSPALLLQWIEAKLGARDIPGRLFSGGVTFCGMRPMRNLPFRVICLLGMNDLAFPRRDRALEFDLMAGQWQAGDPLKSDEDRYLMLETLLCARQALYISYCGRSLKDNSLCQPSVLVRELLDYIDARFGPDASGTSMSARLTTEHAMQAFAAHNYQAPRASYDSYWCRIANAMRKPAAPLALAWPQQSLPVVTLDQQDISLDQLARFLQHPIQYFFNYRLNLRLARDHLLENDEPFELDGLQAWQVKQRLLGGLLAARETSAQQLQAEGQLPHGHAAFEQFAKIHTELGDLLAQLQAYRGVATRSCSFQHSFESGVILSGQVSHYYPDQGLMHYSSATLKAKHLLPLWLEHLALCASAQLGANETSRLFARDGGLELTPLAAPVAIAQLEDYLSLYRAGMERPLAVFPATSYAFAQGKSIVAKWWGDEFRDIPGDYHDPYVQLALRGMGADPLAEPEFAALATRIFKPVLHSLVTL